jgi:Uma2 family endonuclease
MNALLHFDVDTLPVSIVSSKPLSDEAFESLCQANEPVRLERTKEGEAIMHAPAGGFTSSGNAEILRQLSNWWIDHRRGKVFDSSCGFFLADGSMLGPDASYVTPEKLLGIGKDDLTKLPRFCPDFVVELLSPSDRLPVIRAKMESWIRNGVSLGWIIDPYQRQVFVYRSDADPVALSADVVQGFGPIEGFTLDLTEVWRCYEL